MKDGRIGPYRVLGALGSGGMGQVHLAEVVEKAAGLEVGRRVAVKVVHPHLLQTGSYLDRFLQEARIGRTVEHPNVVRCFDCDVTESPEGPCHYLVMEHVEGQTLRGLLDEMGAVPEELARHIAREIAHGLGAIHRAGVLHRDLKPENVLIARDHVVKIMDLGVARLLDEAIRLSQAGAFVGSLEYAAPEQLDGRTAPPDERADLHSLGVVLYELATGRHPYRGDDVRRVLHGVLHETPRRAGDVNPQLSPFFEEVIHTLLAKDREERLGSADELGRVLSDGEQGAWWGERARSLRRAAKRPLRRIRIRRETAVYGREDEIDLLRRLYDSATTGLGQVLLLEGEAGVGKTRLADEFVARLQEEGEDLYFLGGSYPPGGAATAAGAFATAFRDHFGPEALDDAILPYLTATPRLVPAFAALLRGDAPPAGVEALTHASLPTVFVHAAQALAHERPTVVLIEDLHFAPAEGRTIFTSLALAVADHPILLIGTSRPVLEEGTVAEIERLPYGERHVLSRLGARDLVALLADAFQSRPLAEELSGRIAVKSDGNPFFVFEIIRGMRDEGILRLGADGTWDTTELLRDVPVPSSVVDLVNARISDLSREDRELLEVAACCGFEFDPVLVATASGIERVPALKRLGHVERHHRLVRSMGPRMVFDHHQVQESLYGGIMQALREEYHAAIATALEARREPAEHGTRNIEGAPAVEICEHFMLGARPRDARPCLEPALAHLRQGHANERGLRLAESALAAPGLLEGRVRVRVLLAASSFLDPLGRREEQGTLLDEAVSLADTLDEPSLRAETLHTRGWCHFAASRYPEAQADLDRAVALAREAGDSGVEATVQGKLGAVHQRLGRLDEMRACYERWLELAKRDGDVGAAAAATGGLGNHHILLGRHEKARVHYERYLQLAREARDLYNEGVATGNLALVLRYLGRYGEALEHARRRLEIAREYGDRRLEAVACLNLASLYLSLGDMREGRDLAESGARVLREIDARRETAIMTELRGSVAEQEGETAEAERRYAEALELFRELKDPGWTASILLTSGRLFEDLGRSEEARARYEEALDLAERQEAPGTSVMAACLLARLPGGDPERAFETHERFGDRLGLGDSMEAGFLLWQLGGDPSHLQEARRLLDLFVAHAPDAYAKTLFGRVNGEIREASERLARDKDA